MEKMEAFMFFMVRTLLRPRVEASCLPAARGSNAA
jgi:hypothetical protein